jgi:hypothetical protein
MNDKAWLTQSDIPPPRTEAKILAFFGIPPGPLEDLDEHIDRKRRSWHAKRNGVSRTGRDRAKAVLDLIDQMSKNVKRGVPVDDTVGGAAPAAGIDDLALTLDSLWSVIDELLANDEFDRALEVAADARRRWPDSPRPHAAYAWVIWVGWQVDYYIRTAALEDGLRLAEHALSLPAASQDGLERVATWESRVGLLLALERPDELLRASRDAEAALGQLPARMRAYRAEGLVMLDRTDEAMAEAVRAVVAARGERTLLAAVRARCAGMVVRRVVQPLLPITSPQAMARYVEAVGVAAWCARGVPDAEDLVRVHRLWAAQASQRVFAGSWELRSFLAICTAFLSLVPHNRSRSKPAWHVYAQGPEAGAAWQLISQTSFVKAAHRGVENQLEWAAGAGSDR